MASFSARILESSFEPKFHRPGRLARNSKSSIECLRIHFTSTNLYWNAWSVVNYKIFVAHKHRRFFSHRDPVTRLRFTAMHSDVTRLPSLHGRFVIEGCGACDLCLGISFSRRRTSSTRSFPLATWKCRKSCDAQRSERPWIASEPGPDCAQGKTPTGCTSCTWLYAGDNCCPSRCQRRVPSDRFSSILRLRSSASEAGDVSPIMLTGLLRRSRFSLSIGGNV